MKKAFINTPRYIWPILIVCIVFAFWMFIPMNTIIKKLRNDEQKKFELWAKAISSKNELVEHTQDFYQKMEENEKTKIKQFIEAYKIIMTQSENTDLTSPKLNFYIKIIMDNKYIPVIITDEFNNITLSQNIDIPKGQTVLAGDLYKRFSKIPPFEYEVYGMKFKLYYTESESFSNIRRVFDDLENSLLNEITQNTILSPVIILDSSHTFIYATGNVPLNKLCKDNIDCTIKEMTQGNTPIVINIDKNTKGYVYYKPSTAITFLGYYPLMYAFVLLLSVVILFIGFRAMRLSQQNFVWVGMSKETAHQLGTPISSLMAWNELLKMNPENESTCREIDKDIQRLNLVAQRFSQIGSDPELKTQDVVKIINNIVDYMQLRVPKKVYLKVDILTSQILEIPLNRPLFEWMIENLIKNAVDAMEGKGTITITLNDADKFIKIDIADTGKGLLKSQIKKIFQPGFTTKKRGWGMGLSFVKRIVETYHKGKIYVKNSTPNVGTTFRIELPK